MSEITTSRLEAFSDGVIAIVVTIMVEVRAPAQPSIPALWKVAPVCASFFTFALIPSLYFLPEKRVVLPESMAH